MCVSSVGKPLVITPVINNDPLPKEDYKPLPKNDNNSSKNYLGNDKSTLDSTSINKPKAKSNIEFIDFDEKTKTLNLGDQNNFLKMEVNDNPDSSSSPIKNASLKFQANDTTFITGKMVGGDISNPNLAFNAQTEISGFKVSTNIDAKKGDSKGAIKAEIKPNEIISFVSEGSLDKDKASGSIKAEIKPINNFTLKTEGSLDSNNKSKLGASAELKFTDSIKAETSINYDENKNTNAVVKTEAKLTENLKLVAGLASDNDKKVQTNAKAEYKFTKDFSVSSGFELKDGEIKTGLNGEYIPFKGAKIISGFDFDKLGNASGNARAEATIEGMTFSSGIETNLVTKDIKTDIKAEGELYRGLKVTSALEYKDEKTKIKGGLSYSAFNDALRVTADTTGTEHSAKIEFGMKF